jgi:hypothetical protein
MVGFESARDLNKYRKSARADFSFFRRPGKLAFTGLRKKKSARVSEAAFGILTSGTIADWLRPSAIVGLEV